MGLARGTVACESDEVDLVLMTKLLAGDRGREKRVLVDEIGDFEAGDGLKVEISANFLFISLAADALHGRMEIPLAVLLAHLGELEGDA